MSEENKNNGKVPVTLFFVREGDQRAFHSHEWVDPNILESEEMNLLILRRWGQLRNCRQVRFQLLVSGHVHAIATGELVHQYVQKSITEASAA
jgi:hypothetical protein